MAERSVSIRLGTTGKADVTRAFDDIAASGDASAKRLTRSYQRAGEDVAAAMQRQAAAAAKIAAITPQTAMQMRVNDANGTGFGEWEGSARRSAAAMKELLAQEEALDARAKALIATLNPLAAAQDRYNAELAEAKALLDSGRISTEQYAAAETRSKAALDAVANAHGRAGMSAGAQRAAMMGLSYQAQDTFTQLALGANPLTVLAIQGGQAAGQMVGLEGKLGAVARFMTGGWGIAITGGLLVLGMLAGKLGETQNAVEDLLDKKRKDANQSRDQEAANRIWANSIDGVIEKTRELNKELTDQLRTRQQVEAGRLSDAERRVNVLYNLRGDDQHAGFRQVTEELATARRELAQAMAARGDARSEGSLAIASNRVSLAQAEVDRLEHRLGLLTEAIDKAKANVVLARIPIMDREVAASLDGVTAATDKYERAKAQLQKQYSDGTITEAQYKARLGDEIKALEAAKKAAQEHSKALSLGTQVNAARGADLFASAERYRGLSETRDNAALQTLFKEANANVDPKMTAWCAAFVNAVLATNGFSGTGSLAARSFTNYGDKVSSPVKGDIVVSQRDGGGHVGFFQGTDAKGNILVLGGNTGDRVGTMTVAKSDVLGFRRPSASDTDRDAAKSARDFARDLAALADELDPVGAASRKYAEKVELIGKGVESGTFTQAQGDQYRDAAWADYLKTLPGSKEPIKGLEPFLEADKERKRAAERRADFIKDTLADQSESLTIAQKELELVGASDDRRASEIEKLKLILKYKGEDVDLEGAKGKQMLANAAHLEELGRMIQDQKAAWDELKQVGGSAIDRLFDPTSAESWGDRLKGILGDLQAELVKMALLNPLKNALFGSGLPTLGGLFAGPSLTSLLAKGNGSPPPVALPGNAIGTDYWSGGATWIAENGPEIVSLPKGSRVTPAAETRRMLAANDAGPPIAIDASIHAPGADAAALARVEANQRAMIEALPGIIVSTVRDARDRRMLR